LCASFSRDSLADLPTGIGVVYLIRFHMDVIPITPERKAQLEAYARRHGQDTAATLDEALAEYLALYTIEGETVSIVHVRHGRRQPITKQ
jgi:hypothetical protein